MKAYKITYNEGVNYNLTDRVSAENQHEALVIFNMQHPHASEIVKIEEE